jgi:hypothetical protein
MAAAPQFASVPRSPHLKITNADGTAPRTIFTMGSNGGIVRAVWAVSNDPTARWITLLHNDGIDDALVATMKFNPALATAPLRTVNFLDPSRLTFLDQFEIQWHLAANHGLKVRMESAVTAAAEVSVFALYGEF